MDGVTRGSPPQLRYPLPGDAFYDNQSDQVSGGAYCLFSGVKWWYFNRDVVADLRVSSSQSASY